MSEEQQRELDKKRVGCSTKKDGYGGVKTMKPIYEIHVPTYISNEDLQQINKHAKEKLEPDYHVVVISCTERFTKTKIIYPTATFWGWWYNLWNA